MATSALWLVLLLASAESSSGHGPHHPREKVVTHSHYRPQRPSSQSLGANDGEVHKLTHDTELLRDADHIREDLGEWVSKEDTRKMTPEELEFHYFKLHDFDNNTKLDGLEILQAIHHTVHSADSKDAGDFLYFVELIDQVLAEDDLDNDGYLSYIEYVLGRQKDQSKHQTKYTKP